MVGRVLVEGWDVRRALEVDVEFRHATGRGDCASDPTRLHLLGSILKIYETVLGEFINRCASWALTAVTAPKAWPTTSFALVAMV